MWIKVFLSSPFSYDLMQYSWDDTPEERPTFLQLVYSMARLLGEEIAQEYFVLEGPHHNQAVHNGYATVHSNNGSSNLTSNPMEYEVPVPSPCKNKNAAPHIFLPGPGTTTPSQRETASAMGKGSSLAKSGPTAPPLYHTLEQPIVT